MTTQADRDRPIFDPPELGCVLHIPGLPGGGGKLHDRSAYGNSGAIVGATWIRLPSGLWCLSFDGSDDKVTITGNPSVDVLAGESFSVSAWALGLAGNTASAEIIQKKGSHYWQLRSSLGHPRLLLFDTSVAAEPRDNNTDLDDGVWHHIVGVRDAAAGIAAIYIEGTLKDSVVDNTTSLSNTDDLKIGGGESQFWKGYIALIKVFRLALDGKKVADIYQAERHWFGVW